MGDMDMVMDTLWVIMGTMVIIMVKDQLMLSMDMDMDMVMDMDMDILMPIMDTITLGRGQLRLLPSMDMVMDMAMDMATMDTMGTFPLMDTMDEYSHVYFISDNVEE